MDDLHLDLLLSFDATTIGGELRKDDGSVRPFHGWIGLMDALDRLRPGWNPVEAPLTPRKTRAAFDGETDRD